MSALETLRADLRDVVGGEGVLRAFEHLPAQLHPPVALLEPSEPYITDDAPDLPYGTWTVGFDVYLIAKRGTPAEQTKQLDYLIAGVLERVGESEVWDLGAVAQPYALAFGDVRYLATRITVTTPTTLTT